MSSDPNNHSTSPDTPVEPDKMPNQASEGPVSMGDQPEVPDPEVPDSQPEVSDGQKESTSDQPAKSSLEKSQSQTGSQPPRQRRRILIGSQRDTAAYRPKPQRDSIQIVGLPSSKKKAKPAKAKPPEPASEARPETPNLPTPTKQASESGIQGEASLGQPAITPAIESKLAEPVQETSAADNLQTLPQVSGTIDEVAAPVTPTTPELPAPEPPTPELSEESGDLPAALEQISRAFVPARTGKLPRPSVRDRLSPDLEDELQEAMGEVPLDDLMADGDAVTKQTALESDSHHTGKVVMVRREDVFVELGGREQGILPLKQFDEPPEVDSEVKVRVVRFNREEGLYELVRPGTAADVGDWSDLEEGMLVEAKITGHNTGGLECEVNRIRGFIPVSQIDIYRVEDLTQFVDEKFTCLVTEANPQRGNLVLSRRALLEREREEARQKLLDSLAPDQIHEGVVRKLVDFGAFVDLGGVDGLLHISQLAWGRVQHPSEVLQEGQTIKVKIRSIDQEGNRISLAYRDMLESPWDNAKMKYPTNSSVKGKVTKLMEFGAFVELEPGVEGLVHISELSHKRVWRVSDVVNEGDEVDVLVLSVDTDAQRISLTMKGLIPEPEPKSEEDSESAEKEEASEAAAEPPTKATNKPTKPLKGGLGRSPNKFGLNL